MILLFRTPNIIVVKIYSKQTKNSSFNRINKYKCNCIINHKIKIDTNLLKQQIKIPYHIFLIRTVYRRTEIIHNYYHRAIESNFQVDDH